MTKPPQTRRIQDYLGLNNPSIRMHLESGGIAPYLATQDQRVVDIMVNGPGEMFLQIAGKPGYQRVKAPGISQHWAESLCATISSATAKGYDAQDFPLLLSNLAGGHRFTGLTGYPTTHGIAISIRVRRHIELPLAAFGLDDRARAVFRRAEQAKIYAEEAGLPVVDRLQRIVLRRGNILISGGTGTGKTTLFNSLLRWIPATERLIKVEDVDEIILSQPNHLGLLVSRQDKKAIGHREIIDSILRLNPDRILISELSIHNAAPSFRLLNTGHGGIMLTAHANDPLEALEAWRRNYELSEKLGGEAVITFLARNLDAIIQIDWDADDEDGQMRRSSVVFKGEDGTLDMPWRELLGVGQASMVQELRRIAESIENKKSSEQTH